ncbi:MAG: hypothetical protein CSA22_06920 [Deltaproteobacteria bacterium]|nr:MAG: hypothetical protein CSA22_06920 [Deltaproteobacteria bacterium]
MVEIRPAFTEGTIAKPLLFTVALRAFGTRQKHPVLGDEKSAQLMELIDYDFQSVANCIK